MRSFDGQEDAMNMLPDSEFAGKKKGEKTEV